MIGAAGAIPGDQMERDGTSREKIIEGAIQVFAQHGYEQASTTRIARVAGLSKGLIFHYFGSKADLYVTTYQEAIAIMVERIFSRIDFAETDILRRFRDTVWLKLQLMREYPDIFEFLRLAYFEQPAGFRNRIQQINTELLDPGLGRIYQNIDYTLFRDGIDVSLAFTVINSTLEKWSEKYVRDHFRDELDPFSGEAVLSQLDPLLSFFRTCFYKEGKNE
jgi:TetR/AcrR family transcriptional regulator